jgi:predicted XRE-type DNA-binding protein
MVNAMFDITDNGMSQYQAAQKYGIPQTTISSRFRGQTALPDQNHPRRHLSRNQEDKLVTWILRQKSLDYAPSHSQIRTCIIALQKQQSYGEDV